MKKERKRNNNENTFTVKGCIIALMDALKELDLGFDFSDIELDKRFNVPGFRYHEDFGFLISMKSNEIPNFIIRKDEKSLSISSFPWYVKEIFPPDDEGKYVTVFTMEDEI